jgi:hypothetical protein
MATHIKLTGIFHIILGGLTVLAGIVVAMIFGGVAGLVGVNGTAGDNAVAIPLLGGIGSLVLFILALIGIPGIIAGIGLLQFRPWARILAIIISVIDLFNLPFGTALGVYGLWALLSPEGEALFRRPAQYPVPQRY